MIFSNSAGYSRALTSLRVSEIVANTNSLRVGVSGVYCSLIALKVIASDFQSLNAFHPNRIDMALKVKTLPESVKLNVNRRHIAEHIEKLKASNSIGSSKPIWIMGSNMKSAQLAGNLGIPFSVISEGSINDVMNTIKCYREAFKPSEYLSKPYIRVGVNVIAAATDQYASYLASSWQRLVISNRRGSGVGFKPPTVNYLDHISDEDKGLLKQFLGRTVIGSKVTVTREIRALLKMTNADELLVSSRIFEHDALLNSNQLIAEALN
ncbi:hypothetical protein [Methylophilus luteus]|uniref:Luciferase-like domain-containing protein n=1 Tax=Methylophilus luteus TaxID=640108 RepID=A0ABW3F8F6_9PROT